MHDESQHESEPRLILASGSPRRCELLVQAGYRFDVVLPPDGEPEELAPDTSPESRAEALSYFKARSVANFVGEGVVLAADTVVALDREVFGKPADVDDARRILASLAGTTHRVITGFTILAADGRRRNIGHDVTTVRMRPMPDELMARYLASDAWRGKAGAYGIQDRGDPFVERLEGSYTNVVGMPMERITELLGQWGIRSSCPSAAQGHSN
jgi:septum formation protein